MPQIIFVVALAKNDPNTGHDMKHENKLEDGPQDKGDIE